MRLVMLRLKCSGAAEAFDRLLCLPKPQQGDSPIVVSRDQARIGPERLLEIADGRAVIAPSGDGHAQIVADRGITWGNRARHAIDAFRLRQSPGLKMRYGVSDERPKVGR